MRLRIVHEIVARYDPPAQSLIRTVLMTPRTYDGQYVGSWRIDVDHDCRLDRVFDPFGNVAHNFSFAGPVPRLSIVATGEVEVDDTAGVLPASAHERLPAAVFRRSTPLTEIDAAVEALARRVSDLGGATLLDRCHALKSILHAEFEHHDTEPSTAVEASARRVPDVLAAGAGDAVDVAHVFVAVSRALGAPARFVSGYLWRGDRRDAGGAVHAWAETFVDGLGWVGFDPSLDRCPTDAYVRVSAALDRQGACFVRGAETGTGPATVQCRAMVTQADL
jgi:transglutaminase-like putative cysteine protease